MFVQTFSKNWAMTGWRIGWLEAPASLGPIVENLVQYSTSGVPVPCSAPQSRRSNKAKRLSSLKSHARKQTAICLVEALAQNGHAHFAVPHGAFYFFGALATELDRARSRSTSSDEARGRGRAGYRVRQRRRALHPDVLRAPARGHDPSRAAADGVARAGEIAPEDAAKAPPRGRHACRRGDRRRPAPGFAQVPGGWLSGAMIGVADLRRARRGRATRRRRCGKLAHWLGCGYRLAMFPAMLKSLRRVSREPRLHGGGGRGDPPTSQPPCCSRIPALVAGRPLLDRSASALSYVFLVAAQDGKGRTCRVQQRSKSAACFLMALVR